jgi:serine/threonine-protein kinase
MPDDRRVALVVSLGPGIAVPDVIGMRRPSAIVTVERSGLIARVIGYGTSVGIPRGWVIDTEPPPGSSAPPGSIIGLVVSGGRPPGVPALAAMGGGEAKRVLRAMGLDYVIGAKRFSSSIPRGCIVEQTPAGGSDRPADGRVYVVLSLGCGVVMPDLSGLNEAGAHRSLERAGLRVKVERRYSETPAGTVIGWQPGAGRMLPSGGVATLVVSAGPEPSGGGDGLLRVETAPAELDVWVYVDGEGPLGKTPATIRMSAGSHRLVLYAPDRGGRDNIHVAVRPGETVVIERSLR